MVALVRFGRWDEVLALPAPPARVALHDRRVALRARHRVQRQGPGGRRRAGAGRAGGRSSSRCRPSARSRSSSGRRTCCRWRPTCWPARWRPRPATSASAERLLRAAMAEQDTHWFTEPPPWYFPVRQSLGAVLLQAGRPADAEVVYREDLRRNPGNGWSLFGLAPEPAGAGQDRRGRRRPTALPRGVGAGRRDAHRVAVLSSSAVSARGAGALAISSASSRARSASSGRRRSRTRRASSSRPIFT